MDYDDSIKYIPIILKPNKIFNLIYIDDIIDVIYYQIISFEDFKKIKKTQYEMKWTGRKSIHKL